MCILKFWQTFRISSGPRYVCLFVFFVKPTSSKSHDAVRMLAAEPRCLVFVYWHIFVPFSPFFFVHQAV